MPIAIKFSPAERIRRAKAAEPSLTEDQLCEKLGMTNGQIKAAFAYRNPGQKPGRKRP